MVAGGTMTMPWPRYTGAICAIETVTPRGEEKVNCVTPVDRRWHYLSLNRNDFPRCGNVFHNAGNDYD